MVGQGRSRGLVRGGVGVGQGRSRVVGQGRSRGWSGEE